jgi:hypothetical protein
MVSLPTLLRITAHATPHKSDPPNAQEFYAALGKLIIAWGRLEGHIIGALLMIVALPEASQFAEPLPLAWKRRKDLWERAFDKIPVLKAHQPRATDFMVRLIDEAESRNFAAHAVWDEFKLGAKEPTMPGRTIQPQRGDPNTIKVMDIDVSLSKLKPALALANQLNSELVEFTTLLHSLRPPPPNIRKL